MTRAALFALALALAVWPLAGRADDYGPRRDIRAIRHDLPILLATTLEENRAFVSSIVIDNVIVHGSSATAQWSFAGFTMTYSLFYRFDRWWLDIANIDVSPILFGTRSGPRSIMSFDSPASKVYAGNYAMTVTLARNDGSTEAAIANIKGRPPTEAESWMTLGGNSYFFFSGTVQSAQPVHVQAGTTIDVWFPFVLDPSLHYSLTIGGHGFAPLGPIDGTLKNNTLHFVLPAFTAPPGVDLTGEIESYLSSSVTSD